MAEIFQSRLSRTKSVERRGQQRSAESYQFSFLIFTGCEAANAATDAATDAATNATAAVTQVSIPLSTTDLKKNKARYTANTSCGRVGRGGNARFPT